MTANNNILFFFVSKLKIVLQLFYVATYLERKSFKTVQAKFYWKFKNHPQKSLINRRISQNVKIIARLEFELTYFQAAVQNFSHYAAEFQPWVKSICLRKDLYSIRILDIILFVSKSFVFKIDT